MVKANIQTQTVQRKSRSTISPKLMVPIISHSQSLPLFLQKQQEVSVASNSLAYTKPNQLSSSSNLNKVWLKSNNTKEVATSSPYTQKMPLAQPIQQISNNRAIARQTNAVDNSQVQLAMARNSSTSISSPDNGTTPVSGLDITKIAETVSRILARQLTVERERRGMGR